MERVPAPLVGAGQGGGSRHAEPFGAACPNAPAQCDERRAPSLARPPAQAGLGFPVPAPGCPRRVHRRLRLLRGANNRRPPDYGSGGDGATHSTNEEVAHDAARSAALRAMGFDVLRFTNDDVFRNLGGVLETIRLRLAELRPRIDDSAI